MNEIGNLGPIIQPAPKDTGFSIVGAQNTDSFGTSHWQDFLNTRKLLNAWEPPLNSPYKRFVKTKLIESINHVGPQIQPRYSEGEQTSERELQNLIANGVLGEDTAVILDSGGAHSVAMSVQLAEQGYQPIVMFNNTPHPKGVNKSEQELATLLYFAQQAGQLKGQGIVKGDSPPVFVLDCHRDDGMLGHGKDAVNNSYTYRPSDFPSASELRRHGITKIVYLNEGNQHGGINPSYQSMDRLGNDLKPIAKEYEKAGIQMLYTGISPWGEHRSSLSDFSHFDF
ncbi:MAG: hypothetical protein NT149_03240 [Candidatus Gottesmanbacteria bacterium]|nr:hypothetical protein [Candidatus Gottesmanbacteria bacterium]